VRERLEEERDETDDAVFMSSFIPRNLGEVYDPERDVDLVNAGRGDELIYSTLTGVLSATTVGSTSKPNPSAEVPETGDTKAEAADVSVAQEGQDHSEDFEEEEDKSRPRGFRNEDKDAKKVSQSCTVKLIFRKESRLSRRPSESSDSTRCPRLRRRG
jgi:RIO kinase 1